MAIERIGAQNFRALNIDPDDMLLGNITVLCGANSVGKSSIQKSLLMVKQIDAEGDLEKDIIPLRGKIVDLGSYVTLVQNHDLTNDIVVTISAKAKLKSMQIDLTLTDSICYELAFSPKDIGKSKSNEQQYIPYLKKLLISANDINGDPVANVEFSGDENGNYSARGSFRELIKPDLKNSSDMESVIDKYNAKAKKKPSEFWEAYDKIRFAGDCEKEWKIWCDEPEHSSYLEAAKIWCNNAVKEAWEKDSAGNGLLKPNDIMTSAQAEFKSFPFVDGLLIGEKRTSGGKEKDLIEEFLSVVQKEVSLRKILEKIEYIGPIRETPTRYKVYSESAASSVGIRGENAPYLLARRNDDPILKPWRITAGAVFEQLKDEKSGDPMDSTLGQEVNVWMKLMTGEEVQCSINKDNYPGLVTTNLLKERQNEAVSVSMSDVGFGVGQVFPIVVEGVMMGNDETLFVEQPEVHLHPKMQGDLADFFIAQALSGKQFIIETHSDHIINRLVRRVVEDGLDGDEVGIKDLVKIYFAEKKNGEVELNEVEVSDVTGIVDWPPDFFDQNINDREATVQVTLKKMQRMVRPGGSQ